MASIKQVTGLMPTEYEHPADRKALDALEATPGMDKLAELVYKYLNERLFTIEYTGSHLLVTPEAYPDLYSVFDQVCDTINMPGRPKLYVMQDPTINAFSDGVEQPFVVLHHRAVDAFTDEEMRYVIGHEIGHHKSQHILYHAVAQYWEMLAEIASDVTFGISGLVTTPARYALLYWQRMSEFTADRAGLLACQDLNVAASAMVKIAGMPERYYHDIKIEAYLEQAQQFRDFDYSTLNQVYRVISTAFLDHPWMVIRTAELLNWIDSGEYQRVLDRQATQSVIGTPFQTGPAGTVCLACGRPLTPGEAFCSHCGHPTGGSPQPTEPAEQRQPVSHAGTRRVD
jgi:Zn-dependent protease with chaperone function